MRPSTISALAVGCVAAGGGVWSSLGTDSTDSALISLSGGGTDALRACAGKGGGADVRTGSGGGAERRRAGGGLGEGRGGIEG
jgi:hypothetical protein